MTNKTLYQYTLNTDNKYAASATSNGEEKSNITPTLNVVYNFNQDSTYAQAINGFSWDIGTRAIEDPAGQTEKGGVYFFSGSPDPTTQATDEQRFYYPENPEIYIKRRIFIPNNFYIRHCYALNMSTSISGWQVGDAVTGADGTSHGIIDYISSNQLYLDYPDNGWSNTAWVGTISNTTRSTTATSTSRGNLENGNKHLVLFCDGYSNSGKSPTIIFGIHGETKSGEVGIDFSIAVDGFGSGQQPNTHFDSVPFLTSSDNGKWLDIIYYIKMSSSSSVYDGIVRLWKRTEGQVNYTKIIEATNMNMGARGDASPAYCKFKQGYCFGYSNSGFNVDTIFNEAEFIMSNTPIDGVS